jgi:hypothetical protein
MTEGKSKKRDKKREKRGERYGAGWGNFTLNRTENKNKRGAYLTAAYSIQNQRKSGLHNYA